jgi:hypothetical protein
MYSLVAAVGISYVYIAPSVDTLEKKLGIKKLEEPMLMHIQSKLSTSNITQELFSSFAAR